MNVLITDGNNRASLAATRSLGRRGYCIVVTGEEKNTLASVSKYCAKSFKVSNPLVDESLYFQDIENIIHDAAIDVVLPITEPSMRVLLMNKDSLPRNISLAAPDWDAMKMVLDKVALMQIAEECRVPTPRFIVIQNRAAYSDRDIQGEELPFSFPVVVKPYSSRIPAGRGYIHGGVMYARNREELDDLYRNKQVLDHPSMIQEKITGQGTALFTLFDRDRPLALFCHRRLREKPPSGGVSVVSESIPLDEEMVEFSLRLLSTIGWTGVAMVEFKRDVRDGKPKLMEINGRFWGSLQLAIACGVDFPALFMDYVQGRNPGQIMKDYRIGHKLKWFLGTLDHLLIRLKEDDGELQLSPENPSKMQAVLDFMNIWEKDTSFDVANREDVRPFLWQRWVRSNR
ncbi:MAG TPA: ATP-grasp domain-containing protein [Syntrophorhabdus sp.]|nr:ATP-grasp domain-containing protein [Syntrophorhabdus sp.]